MSAILYPEAVYRAAGRIWKWLATHSCDGVCPHDSCFLSVVRGFRNGAIYGAKIRFPHALVMTVLFRSGSLSGKVESILRATYTHSRNLASFVALYKFFCCVMRHVRGTESGINAFVAGCLGAWQIWGPYNAINSQINMYILSRITMGLVRTAIRHNVVSEYKYAYPVFASVCWGIVMYLFHYEDGVLQKSLISSMTYLYADSDKWPTDASNAIEWFMN